MGMTSDLKSSQRVTAFDSPEDRGILDKLDYHLAHVKHSLAVARKSIDKIHGLANPREDENKPGLSLKSMSNETNKNGKATKLRLQIQNEQNLEASLVERCQHVSVLPAVSSDIMTRMISKSRRGVSFNVNANYNASKQDLPPESESNVDHTRPQEADLDTPAREEGLGPTLAGEDGVAPIYSEYGIGPTLAGEDGVAPTYSEYGIGPKLTGEDGVAPTYSEDGVGPTLAGEDGAAPTYLEYGVGPKLTGEDGVAPTYSEDGVGPTLTGEDGVAPTHSQDGVGPTLTGEDGVDPTLAEKRGSSQDYEKRSVSTEATKSTSGSDAEKVKEVPINLDTLPAPSIIIISATPYERELEEDTVEIEEMIVPAPSSSSSEKRVSKQVSFNETSIEDVIIIPECSTTTRRTSYDESTLVPAEKRKMDEETRKMPIKKADSIDMVIKSASKVLEELRQANEAEVAAKIEAFDPSADTTPATGTEMFADTKRDEKGSHVVTDRISFGLEPDHDQRDREISMLTERSDQDAGSVYEETLEHPKSLTHVLKSIDRVIYKDGVAMMWKKLEYSDVEVLVPVPPNSMYSDQAHSIMSATTVDKEKTKKLLRESCDAFVKRHLGAAAYREIFQTVKPPEIKKKIPGADWALQQKSQKYFSKPPILYWEQWKINNLKKNYLGPGSYEMKDFIQLGNAKPRSERGICDNLGPRFDKATQSSTPGPGTYGIGGVPHKALEDRANRSFSTRGILDAADRSRNLPYQGCDLAPGTYKQKSFVDELLNKVTGLRGPYDLFTARRKDPVKTGFYPTPKRSKIGPGYYSYKSFVDELTTSKYNLRGRFSKQAQYPDVATERFVLFSKATPSLDKDIPGPGAYDVKELPKYTSVNPPAFLSSSSRNDKMSERIFSMTCHPVGPGRYSAEKFQDQYVNGHTNVFKSKTGQPSLKMARFHEERLKSKQRNVEISSCYPGKTNRSITGM